MIAATAILRKEHETILGMLEATEDVARQLDRGERVAPEKLADLIGFFRQFAERSHLQKEEGLLFPLLEKKGMSSASGPIGMMLAEHEQGRSLLALLEEITAAYKRDASGAAQRWAEIARVYTTMLRFHIQVENKVLLRMAESLLTEAEQYDLAATFQNSEKRDEAPQFRDACPCLWIG